MNAWSNGTVHQCGGGGLPSTPALKEGFPGARPSPLGRLWWRGWWERGWWVSYCLVNFRLKDPAQSQLCSHWNDHLVKPSAWCCSPSHMTGSWSDRVFTTSASLTGSFYPSQEIFWLARNLSPMKLSMLLPRALRWHWRVIPSLVSGVIRSWEPLRAVHFVLPSINDISTLSPMSGIAKTVPLYLPQRRAHFPLPGSWALGSSSARASIHEFTTLTTLFTVGVDIRIKLLFSGGHVLYWQRKSVPKTSLALYLQAQERDGNFMDNLLSKLRLLLPS